MTTVSPAGLQWVSPETFDRFVKKCRAVVPLYDSVVVKDGHHALNIYTLPEKDSKSEILARKVTHHSIKPFTKDTEHFLNHRACLEILS